MMRKLLLACLFLLAFFTVAAAQPAPPRKDAEGFEPVNGEMLAPGESIPASRLVGAAYGFILAAVVLYVASVTARVRRVQDDLEELRRKLDASAK
jgi:hypothetical protein